MPDTAAKEQTKEAAPAMTKDKIPPDSPKKPTLSAEDGTLWDFVTRSVRPLSGRSRARVRERAADQMKKAAPPTAVDAPVIIPQPLPAPRFGLKPLSTQMEQETLGIDRRTADKLRKGQMPIEGVLDLHGLRQGEAQGQLTRFLTNGYQAGRRCVLVITGKGSRNGEPGGEAGILRRMVPLWLDMSPLASMILMHSPAKPKDGGDGAFYILLRRKR